MQAWARIEEHDAEQREQEQAALELQQALAEYLGMQDAQTSEHGPKRQAVNDSWASLEKRVMGISVTPVQSSQQHRASGGQPRMQTPARSFRSSIGLPNDPHGVNIGEMVAQVARDRKARCEAGNV